MGRGALRLLIFADPAMASSMAMLAAALRISSLRADIEVAGIIDTAHRPPPPLRLGRALAGSRLRALSNLRTAAEPQDQPPLFATCPALARRQRIPLLAPREAGVNDPRFVETIRRLEPDATIALMVAQIFRAPLLAACKMPLNYHNGLLPQYRGVAATGWSIYERAPRSGFSFHRMSDQVDGGPILLQDAVRLGPLAAAAPIERAKTELACSELNRLFDMLRSPTANPAEQSGPGSSFSRRDLRAITTIENPADLDLDELELRLRAFERLELTLAGVPWGVTALRRVGRHPRNRRLAFTTADGVSVEPSRLMHLPPILYRGLRPLIRSG